MSVMSGPWLSSSSALQLSPWAFPLLEQIDMAAELVSVVTTTSLPLETYNLRELVEHDRALEPHAVGVTRQL